MKLRPERSGQRGRETGREVAVVPIESVELEPEAWVVDDPVHPRDVSCSFVSSAWVRTDRATDRPYWAKRW